MKFKSQNNNRPRPMELKKEDYLRLEKMVGKEKAFRIMLMASANRIFLASERGNATLH